MSNTIPPPPQTKSHVSFTEVESYVFKKGIWEYRQAELGRTVQGIPGTWTPKYDGAPDWLLAMISCPACGTNLLLHHRIHEINRLGRIFPDTECSGCSFHRTCYLDQWGDKTLYAAAITVDGIPEIQYMHANSVPEARLHLGPLTREGKKIHVVAVGPAIGHFVHDEHGEQLSADRGKGTD